MASEKTKIRVIKDTTTTKATVKKAGKKAASKEKTKKKSRLPKPLRVIFAPFISIGRYFRLSWIELRQVRWPNRRTTWKLTAMVIVYCIIFAVIITLLDMLFQFIFNKALG
ncbi:MAG: preprotein translocase subunit SecE [Candidatus Nomurabacteria bacterium]|jgi:preprotein translocase SecE subunit|nr:preprotein translocase subunit SecE [Candidatus Nomurabacteria bacterium]